MLVQNGLAANRQLDERIRFVLGLGRVGGAAVRALLPVAVGLQDALDLQLGRELLLLPGVLRARSVIKRF